MVGDPYCGPMLELKVLPQAAGTYTWHIELTAKDHSGTRNLSYRAAGTLSGLDQLLGEFEMSVHDEIRSAWTPMPLSHRRDVRSAIEDIVIGALAALDDCGRLTGLSRR